MINKQAFEEFLKRIAEINIVQKKLDIEINEDYKERNIHWKMADGSESERIKEEHNEDSNFAVFYIDRVGNEGYIETTVDTEFGPEDLAKGPSVQLFDTFVLILDTNDKLFCLGYEDITKLATEY